MPPISVRDPMNVPLRPREPHQDRPNGARPAALLSVSGLVAGYGGSPVVKNVSIQVGTAEVVSVVGPNGCGKSTLLKAILGLVDVSAGRIALDGRDITRTDTYRLAREQIGYVPQSREVFDALSVMENLLVAGQSLGKRRSRERIGETLDASPRLRALVNRRAGVLSGGERRILAIAMALLAPRQLLVLDEPTAALAPGLAADFLESQVPVIAQAGAAVLIVEQRVQACFSVSDWAYSMMAGEVFLDGRPDRLLADDEFARSLVG